MVCRDRAGIRRKRSLSPLVVLVALGAATVAFAGPSSAQGSGGGSGAFGFSATVALFGGAQPPQGPAPTVTLPAEGSANPITGSAPSATVKFGPATIFTSGPLEVSTRGSTGGGGSVTSSSKATNLNTSGQEVLNAASIESTCTASASGANGSTTVSGGKLRVSEGNPDVDDDDTVVDVPANPAPNTVIEGTVELGDVDDNWRYVFNEHVMGSDGSVTVNAAHQYLLGPAATGDLYIGQSRCARTGSGTATTVASGNRTGSATTVAAGRGVADTGTEVLPLLLPAAALIVVGTTAVLVARRRRVRAGDSGGS